MGKVVIFGATGTVGAYTALDLKSRGYEICAVARRTDKNDFFKKKDIPYYSVDISDFNSFSELPVEGVECVIHLAGAMPSKMEGYNPQAYIDSVVQGTFNVLEYSRKCGAKKIIFTQTRADSNHLAGQGGKIGSDIARSNPKTGDHAVYTIAKNFAVDLIEHYSYEYSIEHVIFRLPTIYAYHPNKYFYVNGEKKIKAYWKIINMAMEGKDLEVWGDPGKEKEIFYIKDMVSLLHLATKSVNINGVFNAGRGVGVSMEQQVLGIAEVFSSCKSSILYRPEMPDSREFIHDIEKTKRLLGFEPQFGYIEMLEDMKEEIELQRFAELWGDEKSYE